MARQQRWRQRKIDVVLIEARLRAHLDHIAEAGGRYQRGLCTVALDQRVRRQGRTVNNLLNGFWFDTRRFAHGKGARHDRFVRRGMRGQNLADELRVVNLQHQIGEGATDIDSEAYGFHVC